MQQKRAAYAAFEKTILELYDQETLTLERLDHIANQYCWQELDSAGSQWRLALDGKDLYQVCISLVDPTFPLPLRGSSEDHEAYWEQELRKWEDIVRWRWDWHSYETTSSTQRQKREKG